MTHPDFPAATAAAEAHRTMTESEVAAMLDVCVRTLRNLRSRDEGPPYVLLSARNVVYLPADVAAYLEERRVVPSRQPKPQVPLPPRRPGRPTKSEKMARERKRMGWRGEQA